MIFIVNRSFRYRYNTPEAPKLAELPAEPRIEQKAEAEAARRDLEERMRQASMNRKKSVLSTPELVTSVRPNRQMLLSSKLGS